jgi:hypothetical protein
MFIQFRVLGTCPSTHQSKDQFGVALFGWPCL